MDRLYVRENVAKLTKRMRKSWNGYKFYYIAIFVTSILLFLFRSVLFSTRESGTGRKKNQKFGL